MLVDAVLQALLVVGVAGFGAVTLRAVCYAVVCLVDLFFVRLSVMCFLVVGGGGGGKGSWWGSHW